LTGLEWSIFIDLAIDTDLVILMVFFWMMSGLNSAASVGQRYILAGVSDLFAQIPR